MDSTYDATSRQVAVDFVGELRFGSRITGVFQVNGLHDKNDDRPHRDWAFRSTVTWNSDQKFCLPFHVVTCTDE